MTLLPADFVRIIEPRETVSFSHRVGRWIRRHPGKLATLLVIAALGWVPLPWIIGSRDDNESDIGFLQHESPAISRTSKLPDWVEYVRDSHKDGPDGGIIHRSVYLIYKRPVEEKAVRETLRMIFESYRGEIEILNPTARWKRIHIVMASCQLEADHGLPFAVCSTTAGPTLPKWGECDVKVSQRDEKTRLGSAESLLVEAILGFEIKADRDSTAPYRNSEGMLFIPESDALLQSAVYEKLKKQNRQEFIETTGYTESDLSRAWHKWMIWSSGRPATEEAVSEAVRDDQTETSE